MTTVYVKPSFGFTEDNFLKRLRSLSDNAELIQTIGHWIIFHRKRHAVKAVDIWYAELQRVPAERKPHFLFLANEVIQTSRRKGPEFLEAFAAVLPTAVHHLYAQARPASHDVILRTINVWAQRQVYSPRFCNELRAAFSSTPLAAEYVPSTAAEAHSPSPPPSQPLVDDPPAEEALPHQSPPTSPPPPPHNHEVNVQENHPSSSSSSPLPPSSSSSSSAALSPASPLETPSNDPHSSHHHERAFEALQPVQPSGSHPSLLLGLLEMVEQASVAADLAEENVEKIAPELLDGGRLQQSLLALQSTADTLGMRKLDARLQQSLGLLRHLELGIAAEKELRTQLCDALQEVLTQQRQSLGKIELQWETIHSKAATLESGRQQLFAAAGILSPINVTPSRMSPREDME